MIADSYRLLTSDAAVRGRPADSDHVPLNDNAAAGAPTSNGVASDQNL
jgi:hypothetical protein